MLRLAKMWMEGGLIGALFGFTGILDTMAIVAQAAFAVCCFFCLLSLLFSLFEAPELPTTNPQPASMTVQPTGSTEFVVLPQAKSALRVAHLGASPQARSVHALS